MGLGFRVNNPPPLNRDYNPNNGEANGKENGKSNGKLRYIELCRGYVGHNTCILIVLLV